MSSGKFSPPPPAQQPIHRETRSFATLRAIAALVLREMATRYGRSPGGYVWAVLEPLGGIIILAVGFSLVIRNPPLGNSFVLFYATGFLPFGLYQSLSGHIMRCINFSRALLHYPSVTWVDAVLARFSLNLLTELLVMILLLGVLLNITNTLVILEFGPIFLSIALAALLGLGVGVLNCALMGLFPIWAQIWSIVTRPLFLMSGIFFLQESLPPLVQDILWWNPLSHVTALMRVGFYPTYRGDFVNLPYVAGFGLICLFFGVVLMGRYHRDILNDN